MMAETNDVVCPTCNAQVGKPCSKRFTDWPESIPHETRAEAAERVAPPPPEPEAETEPSPPPRLLSQPALPALDDLFTQPARGRGSRALDDEHRAQQRSLSRNETSQRYSCQLCGDMEEYRALDNVARYAHLCRGCWLDATDVQREHYKRLKPGDTKPDIPVMRKRIEYLGFSRLTIPPESTAMDQVVPQYQVCRPTHLHIVQRSGPPGAMLSMLRNGNYEHLMAPVPIELFRAISDELVRELSRTYTNADSLAAVLLNQGRVDMGTALIGNCLTIAVQNPDKHEECVIDAVMRVDTVVESRCL